MTTHAPAGVIEAVGMSRAEARALMTHQNEAFLDLLRSLSSEEWDATTDCAPWTPKDIAAHVLGWADAFASFKELRHQYAAAYKRRSEFGNITDAVNQVQVDERKGLALDELVRRLEEALPRFARFRGRIAGPGRFVPFYDPGLLGRVNLAYVMNTIFTRDTFMHRVDIARATGKQLLLGLREARLIEDVVVDWGDRTGANAIVGLTGPAGGVYRVGSGDAATIEGDAIEFSRVLAGRGRIADLSLSGEVPAAESWLGQGCPF